MDQREHRVTRLPGAPVRRAGRDWEAGRPTLCRLDASQTLAIKADPGYLIEEVATQQPAVATRRAK